MKLSKKYKGVYHYKKKDGEISYYITYRDETNKFSRLKIGDKSKGITENYCNQKRNEILNKIRLGEEPPHIVRRKKKNRTVFNDIAEIYFEAKALHNKSNAHEKMRYIKNIRETFGFKDIEYIKSDDIEKFQRFKAETLAPKTVNNLLSLISVIYNTAIDKDIHRGLNPVQRVKPLSVDNQRERFLTADEVKLLLDEVRNNEFIYLFCLLALSTGARLNAVLQMKKKDIDIVNETITIKDFKNDTTYKGFISSELYPLLQDHIKNLRLNDYIINIKGKGLEPMGLSRRLQPILNKLFNVGLDKADSKNRVVVHTLRHTFASHLAINGTPIFTIQKLLNHKDIKMTMRYAKLAPDSGKDMVKRLYL